MAFLTFVVGPVAVLVLIDWNVTPQTWWAAGVASALAGEWAAVAVP